MRACLRIQRVFLRGGRCEDGADGRVLTEGTIDAAAIQDGTWLVLDWKTDAAEGEVWADHALGYEAQVARYVAVLTALGQRGGEGRLVRVR